MQKVAVIIIENSKKQILAVSRKNNHELFGLVGGKIEDDEDVYDAIIRETFEETGLKLYKDDLDLIDERMEGKNYCYLFYANDYFGNILSQDDLNEIGETGIVKWMDRSVLETGFCGEYNTDVFKEYLK